MEYHDFTSKFTNSELPVTRVWRPSQRYAVTQGWEQLTFQDRCNVDRLSCYTFGLASRSKGGSMRLKNETQKSSKAAKATGGAVKGFTDEERAAMKEHAQELKAEASKGSGAKKRDGEGAVLTSIAKMPPSDRAMAERLHAIVKA